MAAILEEHHRTEVEIREVPVEVKDGITLRLSDGEVKHLKSIIGRVSHRSMDLEGQESKEHNRSIFKALESYDPFLSGAPTLATQDIWKQEQAERT